MEDLAFSYLGSGYDVCGEYANPVSIKRKIFNLERIPKKDIRQLSNRNTDFFSVVGETIEEYQSRLSVKAGISGSYGLFSASVEPSFDSSDLAIAESSFRLNCACVTKRGSCKQRLPSTCIPRFWKTSRPRMESG